MGSLRAATVMKGRDMIIGAAAVLLGHVILFYVTRVISGDQAIKVVHRAALVFVGASQLVYVLPLAVVFRRRRPWLALGVVVMAIVTIAVNYWGLTR